jgi:uroporphyrinogen decarboxylase
VPETNSRERIIAALERKEPDRVPLLEWGIDPKVMGAIHPGLSFLDFMDRIGLDTVGTNFSYDLKTSAQVLDADRRIIRDKWGVVRGFTTELIAFPLEGPIKSEADLKSYTPPESDAEGVLGILPEVIARFKGKKAIFWNARDGFVNPANLRGMENLLLDYVQNPRFAHEVTEMCADYEIAVAKRAIKAGADLIMLGDDYAYKTGPLMSPTHFREFIFPILKRTVKAIHEAGGYVVKHTDGNIWPILDMIVESGVDGINPLEPVAGMDIGEVKKKYGHRVAVIGNIDCGDLLSRRPVEEVVRAVKECIRKASPGGGHILSSSNTIHSAVKAENFLAMIETAKEYGKYPIDLGRL